MPVSSSRLRRFRVPLLATALLGLALACSCKRNELAHHEYMYVSAVETSLRDRVATLYNKVGTVRNGDRVEVLEKQRRFLRVRTDSGQEGWVEERSLVPQEIYDGFQKLAKDNASTPVQAHGTTRAELNMHVTPSREAEHLYQLQDGEKIELLKRATAEKTPLKTASAATSSGASNKKKTAATDERTATAQEKPPELPKPVMEDWYLVRNSAGHVGWVLLRMVDLDIPLDIAQYAEGQRIMGYFVLNTVEDQDKPVPQYLVLLNEPKDGLAWDYNQIRIFTWNRARHRYETAYRERNLEGYLPVKTGHQDFGKEGDLPTFTIRKMNESGQMEEVTYKLNGPIVRRVLSPEEEAAQEAKHEALLAAIRAKHPKQSVTHTHRKHH